jgi:hypothetical protein
MCLASLLAKLGREETLNEDDWNDVISLFLTGATWLYENTRVEHTPSTSQVHLQPKSSKKKKSKTKE